MHGRIDKIGAGKYGTTTLTGVLADGQYFGEQVLTEAQSTWEFTAKAETACQLLRLPRSAFTDLAAQSARAGRLTSARPHPLRSGRRTGTAKRTSRWRPVMTASRSCRRTFVDYELCAAGV